MTYEQLETAALNLPSEKRMELAYFLIVSLEREQEPDPEHERLWREEVERRYRDVLEGRAELIPAEEVFKPIRRELSSSEPEQS